MTYSVRFTDTDKSDLTVYDNTSNTDTSLTFPGRNVTGYGQTIAENFLHLLENFSSTTSPVSPIEGQLWYDSGSETLKVSDGLNWKAASGIYKGPVEPGLDASREGELWIDTTNQQLRIFNGSRWILVGPNQTSIEGLKYGPTVETIDDTDNIKRNIISFYVADVPVIIVSKDSFTPKISISGFLTIRSGVNVNVPISGQEGNFDGGFLPKINGIATVAESLRISEGTLPVSASKFLRSDVVNTTDFAFNVRNNSGVTVGVDQNFSLSVSGTTSRIYNSAQNSTINLQVNRGGVPESIVTVTASQGSPRVGVNNLNPQSGLDVAGNIIVRAGVGESGIVTLLNDSNVSGANTGSLRVAGGTSIAKSLRVGENLTVVGQATTGTVFPTDNAPSEGSTGQDLGAISRRWRTVYAKEIIAETVTGALAGSFEGNAKTATSLLNPTTFQITGDIISQVVSFDGTGPGSKTFQTSLTSNIILGKPTLPSGGSRKDDQILVFRSSSVNDSPVNVQAGNFVVGQTYTIVSIGTTNFTLIGATSNSLGVSFVATGAGFGTGVASTTSGITGLVRQNRDTFVGDLGLPIGAILPYAGLIAPTGFLLCDGSEVQRSMYPDLYSIISDYYNNSTENPLLGINTFRVPDLRGRFALGRDTMDNGITVPLPSGGFVDGGGGKANRVPDSTAETIAGSSGSSSRAIALDNLPDHSHNMQTANGTQFFATRVDPASAAPAVPGLGPTASGQAQYLNDSGKVKTPDPQYQLGQPFNIMNPYLTINYIIRSGPPAFTVTT
jgi:microcystin-dependent protein